MIRFEYVPADAHEVDAIQEATYEEADKAFINLSARQCFELYLNYIGIIGYTDVIISMLDELREGEMKTKQELDEEKKSKFNAEPKHNPCNLPAEKIPHGRRFLTKREHEWLNEKIKPVCLGNDITRQSYHLPIWKFDDERGMWSEGPWSGGRESQTYCVPLNYHIEELGNY